MLRGTFRRNSLKTVRFLNRANTTLGHEKESCDRSVPRQHRIFFNNFLTSDLNSSTLIFRKELLSSQLISRRLLFRYWATTKRRIWERFASTYNYFCSVLTDYENDNGEIEKLIRDTRGIYVEPHGGELTQMGTLTVAAYNRPAWTYSNILFLEKEDLVSALRQSGFLNRWDCFALSSKGFSSRAPRDLIDKIGASGKEEPTKSSWLIPPPTKGVTVRCAA